MADYVENALHDREWGEWYAILDRAGHAKADCKGFALKGRIMCACLANLCVLARRYLEGSLPVIGDLPN